MVADRGESTVEKTINSQREGRQNPEDTKERVGHPMPKGQTASLRTTSAKDGDAAGVSIENTASDGDAAGTNCSNTSVGSPAVNLPVRKSLGIAATSHIVT